MQALAEVDGSVHRSFTTTDPDVAHGYVERTFAQHEMTVSGAGAVRFRLDSAVTPDVTVGRMAYGTRARIVGPAMRDCYHVNLLVSGRCTVEQAGRRAEFSAERNQSGVVFGPDEPVYIDWSADCAQYHLKLSRRTLEEHAARLAGRTSASPIAFDLTFPLDNPAGQSLCSAVAFYYSQLSRDGGLVTMRAVQRELESALMTQVLLVARSDLTAALTRSGGEVSDHRICELMEYVRGHAQEDLSVARLSQLAGVTARTLQSGFRREAGMSPSEYVRSVRLDGARADLLAGSAGTVSDVANRWHFFHLGRFAQQYRARFGEAPSRTLPR
ncbi:AraC family transcriptional regulator [Tsukamurella sp. PLM1]|uniref:AraC family transcriptional regulator n=1 Tax=Tsukamurella sp. PLM1 TaxID=2929795 RepID=UPI00204CB691|nr:AraC family transcriptional regulator [Tsukamurella sp. PLM1]BDH55772.1 AraC family transcriptional regulator [Tsukamurella sp. PLM1]